MKSLNLGILAHVDAGKTSLTERLLYSAGVIDKIGSVDHGDTQTDSLDLERQRGITIRAAVVAFTINDVAVNLIDTPGHPDFIAEVERALGVLDGVVLVISAVEGVQAQTRVLLRALHRLGIPAIFFVNKIDRAGARYESLLEEIAEKLTPRAVAMGSVSAIGARDASFTTFHWAEAGRAQRLADVLSERDEALLSAFVADGAIPAARLKRSLARQAKAGAVYPVYFGSALTGAGVKALESGISALLPARKPNSQAPLSGLVFKVERGARAEKVAFARLYAGAVNIRDSVRFGDGHEAKVTALEVFTEGAATPRLSATAGEIVKVWGLAAVQVGEALGLRPHERGRQSFARPALETVVVPAERGDLGALHAALTQMAEQDPLINLRQDDERRELTLSLYGEVQKEVVQATLEAEFGVRAVFRESTPICIERPVGVGEAAEFKRVAPNPFLATVGLRVEPGEEGSGIGFRLDSAALGKMPFAFVQAVEDSVHLTLRQGLHGWQVTDCLVTMTDAGYFARHSHAHQRFNKSMSSTGEDFRNLTPLVLIEALKAAGTIVYEPLEEFRLEFPADLFGAVSAVLTQLRATPGTQESRGPGYLLEGTIPTASVHALRMQLPGLTRGEGVLESAPSSYEPVRGAPPERERRDHNPLDRKEYLLHVQRRV